jgi:hypothetical protein
MMGNKLYVTKLVSDKYKITPDNTVVAQVRILVQLWKQLGSKAAKGAPVERKKYFSLIFKASVVKLVLFYLIWTRFPLPTSFLLPFFRIRRISNYFPHWLSRYYFNLLSAKRQTKGFSLLSGLFYNVFHPRKLLHPTPLNYLIISLTNYLIKFYFASCLNGYQIYFHQNKRRPDRLYEPEVHEHQKKYRKRE